MAFKPKPDDVNQILTPYIKAFWLGRLAFGVVVLVCRTICGIAEDGKIPGTCPFSEKTSEPQGVFLSIQSA